MWKSPNGTIRNILGGTVFREPIICSNVPAPGSGLDQAHRHRPSRLRRPVPRHRLPGPGPGQADDLFTPADGGKPIEYEVFKFPGGGVAMAMYNLDEIDPRLRPRVLQLRPVAKLPVYLSTKNTILKAYDGRSRTCSRRSSTPSSRPEFEAEGHDLRAPADRRHGRVGLKWEAAFWACKNYDGDVQSDTSPRASARSA